MKLVGTVLAAGLLIAKPCTAETAFISTGVFKVFASGCQGAEVDRLKEACAFAQGFLGGVLSGVVSTNKELNGNLTARLGCGDLGKRTVHDFFDEFVSFLQIVEPTLVVT